MDRRTFDQRIEQLRQGEFVEDGSIFPYANDHLYELRRLLEALRFCCDWQKQKIQILKAMNAKVETTLRRQKDEIERLSKLVEDYQKNHYNWVRASARLPETSGEYYTYGSNLGVHSMSYSAKHKLFNTHDASDDLSTAITVTHWCEKPDEPDDAEPAATVNENVADKES